MNRDDDSLLGDLFTALERDVDESARRALLADFTTRHPHLAAEVGVLLDTASRVESSRAEAKQLAKGHKLGPFVVQRLIAIGGMGEIYEAEQEGLGRLVALKVIRHGRASKAAKDRFVNEQRVLARLHHTHIVPVYASGIEGDLHYFAMPYIEGKTLAAVVGRAAARADLGKRVGELWPLARDGGQAANLPGTQTSSQPAARRRPGRDYFRSIAEALAQAAEALQHAHRLGVIHRDLKPSNLMVDPAGSCWIIDFGLAANVEGEKARSGGTPAYMAPEQYEGEPGPRSDVWGLGATLYELLAMRPAFSGSSENAVRQQVLNVEPAAPRSLVRGVPSGLHPPSEGVRGIPRDLEAICLKCLRKQPRERYASAEALARDLRRYLAGEPVEARPVLFGMRLWKWARRRPAAAALGFVLLSAVVVAAGLWESFRNDQAARATARATRQAVLEREIQLALGEARELGEKAWEVTEAPHLWESTLRSALSAIRRADSLAVSEPDLIPAELRHEVATIKKELEADEGDRMLVVELEGIQLDKSTVDLRTGAFQLNLTGPRYAALFRVRGFVVEETQSEQFAAWILQKRAPVQTALIGALDDWLALGAKDRGHQAWLRNVIAQADSDPWRREVRNALAEKKHGALQALSRKADALKQAPVSVIQLAHNLQATGDLSCQMYALTLMREALDKHPLDFWLNYELAKATTTPSVSSPDEHGSPEAVACFIRCLAVRPQNFRVRLDLAFATLQLNEPAKAVVCFEEALKLKPDSYDAQLGLAMALCRNEWQPEGIPMGIAACQAAIDIAPMRPEAHTYLALLHARRGDLNLAVESGKRGVSMDPADALSHMALGNWLFDSGDFSSAEVAYAKAFKLNPEKLQAYGKVGLALRSQGKLNEAYKIFKEIHDREAKVAADYQKLLDKFRKGFPGGRPPFPRPPTRSSASWSMMNETAVMLKLDQDQPEIIRGEAKPRDWGEALRFAQICQYRGANLAAVGYLENALLEIEKLRPPGPISTTREDAARAALLAAHDDALPLGPMQRLELRRKALNWMGTELAAFERIVNERNFDKRYGKPPVVVKYLGIWQSHLAYAGVREAGELSQLGEEERQEWTKFWASVSALRQKAKDQSDRDYRQLQEAGESGVRPK